MTATSGLRAARRTGFVLLAVLWVMVGVSVTGLGLALLARRAVRTAQNRRDETRAAWLAEDCAERVRAVIAAILESRSSDVGVAAATWSGLDTAVAAIALGVVPGRWGRCRVGLRPVGRAINVNTADDELLTRLFLAMGITPGRVDSLTDAILDWRDADDVSRPAGAEASWYIGHGRPPPRNAPFADVRELARVRGLEAIPGLDATFDSVLDVEPGRIVLSRAPLVVLAALPGFTPEAVDRVAADRARGMAVGDLMVLSAGLSPAARTTLLARYPDLVRLTSPEPDAWILTSRAAVGSPPVTSVLELRLVRAGTRAAIVRRRGWME